MDLTTKIIRLKFGRIEVDSLFQSRVRLRLEDIMSNREESSHDRN